jgi:hypothetical protein
MRTPFTSGFLTDWEHQDEITIGLWDGSRDVGKCGILNKSSRRLSGLMTPYSSIMPFITGNLN